MSVPYCSRRTGADLVTEVQQPIRRPAILPARQPSLTATLQLGPRRNPSSETHSVQRPAVQQRTPRSRSSVPWPRKSRGRSPRRRGTNPNASGSEWRSAAATACWAASVNPTAESLNGKWAHPLLQAHRRSRLTCLALCSALRKCWCSGALESSLASCRPGLGRVPRCPASHLHKAARAGGPSTVAADGAKHPALETRPRGRPGEQARRSSRRSRC
jgi:hypothetical protein